MTVYMTIGAPASGKTTWALANAERLNAVVISRDDIRAANGLTKFGDPETEQRLTRIQRSQMEGAFLEGMNVIVADTNIDKTHRKRLIKFCHEHGQDVHTYTFHQPLDTLIVRNANRERKVPNDVIANFFNRMQNVGDELDGGFFPAPAFTARPEHDPEKHDVFLVDIDGTVANHEGVRSVYDESRVLFDKPIPDVIAVVKALHTVYDVVFVSGRKDSCREDTVKWIGRELDINIDNPASGASLFMRKHDDMRPDYMVKADLYDQFVFPYYNVIMVFDDRDQVVRHVRARGVTVAQVRPGRF